MTGIALLWIAVGVSGTVCAFLVWIAFVKHKNESYPSRAWNSSDTWGLGAALVGAVFVILVIGALVITTTRLSCESKARAWRLPEHYGVLTGCLYEYGGRWIPSDQIRVTTVTQP